MSFWTLRPTRRTWLIAGLVVVGILVIVIVSATLPPNFVPPHRAVLIDVERQDGDVTFAFFAMTYPFWGDPRRPHAVWQVQVLDAMSPPVQPVCAACKALAARDAV